MAERLAREEEAKAAEAAEIQQNIEQSIISVMESSGLPRDHTIAVEMLDIAMYAVENNLDTSWDEIAGIVKEKHLQRQNSYISGLPLDQLEELLGVERVNEIAKKTLSRKQSKAPVDQPAEKVSGSILRNSPWD